jgi:hypothetical protein
MAMKILAFILIGLAASVRAACVSDPAGTIDDCGIFTTSLIVKDRMSQAESVFNSGEPISFELQTTNTRNEPATLTASSSCTAVVFDVADSAQRPYWSSADNIVCVQMLQPRNFAPLERVTESATWDQLAADGTPVPPGTYTVTAAVGQYVSGANSFVDCRAPLEKSATLTIR